MHSPGIKKASWIFWVFLFIFTLSISITLIAAAELFLRVREYRLDMKNFKKNDSMFQHAAFLQIRPRPSKENKINNLYFRGDSLDLSPDTFRIFTLGGSTTFCGDLAYEKTYPAILEKKLKEHYPGVKIQVQNAACDWYSTQHSIIRYLFKIRHYQPHLLIMKHAINDLFRSFTADGFALPGSEFSPNYSHYLGPIYRIVTDLEDEAPPRPFELLLFKKFNRLWNKLSTRIHLPTEEMQELAHEIETENAPVHEAEIRKFRSLSVFEGNLRAMARLAQTYGSKLIFLTQPSLYKENMTQKEKDSLYFGPHHMSEKGIYPSIKSLERGVRLFNETIHEVGREQNVPVIDIAAATPKTLEYLNDDVHPTAKAVALEADMIFQEIVNLKIIDEWLAAGKPAPPPSSYREENLEF